jgi:hypothetical protein
MGRILPNGHKIYQHVPLQDPPKFTQNGIFGLKLYHLATLLRAGRHECIKIFRQVVHLSFVAAVSSFELFRRF